MVAKYGSDVVAIAPCSAACCISDNNSTCTADVCLVRRVYD